MTDSKRRKGLMAASAVLSGVLVLSGCSSDDGGKKDGGSSSSDGKQAQAEADKAAAKEASQARIAVQPKTGTTNASINNAGKVTVAEGTLTEVKLTTAEGTPVKGTLSADGKSWKPDAQLERATGYKLAATAKDAKGLLAYENVTFTTVAQGDSFIGTFTPEANSTVGVGMPVSINFDKDIADRKAVQSGITVSSSSGQEVVGHWFNSRRLDFRPEQYWQENSTVTLKLALDGVEGRDGVFGVQQKTVTFKVGRNQVSTVDAASKTMKIQQDGKTVKTIPITAGAPSTPTYNGQMVISEKYKETRMNGATVGFVGKDGKGEYDIKDVPHAMRLSTSGTFIHGSYWGADAFGNRNTSHGCVGLRDVKGANNPGADGAWFYNNSLIGDVVIVKNSKDKTIAPDNGLNGWNMDWAKWKTGSAV